MHRHSQNQDLRLSGVFLVPVYGMCEQCMCVVSPEPMLLADTRTFSTHFANPGSFLLCLSKQETPCSNTCTIMWISNIVNCQSFSEYVVGCIHTFCRILQGYLNAFHMFIKKKQKNRIYKGIKTFSVQKHWMAILSLSQNLRFS